jgi:hypothetical protein
LDEFGPRVFFKPEAVPIGPRLTQLHEATGGRARVFEGSGGIALVDSFRRGIVGTMPGADLIDAIVGLWRALVAGDDAAADRIWLPLAALVSLAQGLDAFLAIEKYLLVKQGVFSNAIVRGPVGYVLDEHTRREVDHLFQLLLARGRRSFHFRQSDDADGDSRSGVSHRLREIVRVRVHYDPAPDDVVQLEIHGLDVDLGDSVSGRVDIAQVAFVPFLGVGLAVGPAVWIVVTAGRHAVARAQVAEHVDVKAVLARLQARDLAGHLHESFFLLQ